MNVRFRAQSSHATKQKTCVLFQRGEIGGVHLVWKNSILCSGGTTYPYIDFNFWRKIKLSFESTKPSAIIAPW